MYLTQAILPSSKMPKEAKGNYDILNHPDKHGGFELGTWTSWLPNTIVLKPEPKTTSFEIAHRFTWEDCLKMQEWFKKWVYSKKDKGYIHPEPLMGGWKEEYFPILKSLFENPNDLPVYYFM